MAKPQENRSMRLEIIEGATLVDYELPDHTDKPRKLSVLQGDDQMILTLNRGFYCPKDRMQLLELARFSKQCAVRVHAPGHNHDRQPLAVERPSTRCRGGLDIPARYGAHHPEGPGHRRVHRPAEQSHDPAHVRARAGFEDVLYHGAQN
jgi:hypothetical protein